MEWYVLIMAALGLMLVLFASGLPIFLAFLVLNLAGLFVLSGSFKGVLLVVNSMYDTGMSLSLAAIPLFILLGEILFRSSAVNVMFDAVDSVVGAVRARLYMVSVLLSTIFGALSGSAMAVAAMMGASLLPEMEKRGYQKQLSLETILGGSTLAPIIPPSVMAVVLGILASVSVAGRTGPMAGFRGYGNSAAAHSGHASLTGWPGRDPHMPPLAYGDVVAPMFASVAILAALEYKARTGLGQHLDISQIEPMVHVIADLYAREPIPDKAGNDDASYLVHGVFPCAGEESWIAIAARTPDEAAALAGELKLGNELSDDATRVATSSRDREELVDRLLEQGVPAAAVKNGKDVFESADLAASGHFVTLDHPVLKASKMPAPPYRFSETPWDVRRAPLLGEHNTQTLGGIAGLNEDELSRLEAEGVIA